MPSLTRCSAIATPGGTAGHFDGLDSLPLTEAKAALLDRLERHVITRVPESTKGNAAESARLAGADRAALFRSIRKLGLRDD